MLNPRMSPENRRCVMSQPARRPLLPGRMLVVLGLLSLVALGAGGCRGGCHRTNIRLDVQHSPGLNAPLTATATLTSAGDPMPGRFLEFYVVQDGTEISPRTPIGTAETNAEGIARLERPEGLKSVLLARERPNKVGVEFVPFRLIDGKRYCDARATAQL